MNFAFQALLFFALILPGLLLRNTYNGRIAKEIVLPQNYPPFSREAIRILGYATVLNVLWVCLSDSIGGHYSYRVDIESVIFLLMGDYSDSHLQRKAIDAVTLHSFKVLAYFGSLYVVSAYIGYKLHTTIRKYGLDKQFKFLRFNNQWHYLLTGEIKEFPETDEPTSQVDVVSISAVMDINNDAYLYVGIVADYELDGRGNLSNLTLVRAYRRKLSDDNTGNGAQRQDLESDERYYRIKGDYFLLDCSKARNLNIDYLYITEQQDSADTTNDVP